MSLPGPSVRIEHPHVFAGGIQRECCVAQRRHSRSKVDSISVQERHARCPVVTLSRSAGQPGLGTRSRGRAPADVTNRLLPVPLCSKRRDVVLHASDCTAATHGGAATEARKRRRKEQAKLTRRNACRQSWVGEGAPSTRWAGSSAPRSTRHQRRINDVRPWVECERAGGVHCSWLSRVAP